jgi:hypothetical protein
VFAGYTARICHTISPKPINRQTPWESRSSVLGTCRQVHYEAFEIAYTACIFDLRFFYTILSANAGFTSDMRAVIQSIKISDNMTNPLIKAPFRGPNEPALGRRMTVFRRRDMREKRKALFPLLQQVYIMCCIERVEEQAKISEAVRQYLGREDVDVIFN